MIVNKLKNKILKGERYEIKYNSQQKNFLPIFICLPIILNIQYRSTK